MTINQYWAQVGRTYAIYPGWRYGQTVWNILHTLRPKMAFRLRKAGLDPFYADSDSQRIADATNWINAHWGMED